MRTDEGVFEYIPDENGAFAFAGAFDLSTINYALKWQTPTTGGYRLVDGFLIKGDRNGTE